MANFHFQQAYDLRMNMTSDETTDALACYRAMKSHDNSFESPNVDFSGLRVPG